VVEALEGEGRGGKAKEEGRGGVAKEEGRGGAAGEEWRRADPGLCGASSDARVMGLATLTGHYLKYV
jgi:hypothetical protein